jgi:hypothetical protein
VGKEAVASKAVKIAESIVAMAREGAETMELAVDTLVIVDNSLMEDVEESEAGAIKASVTAGNGAEGAKKAADDVMGAVEGALEQVKDGSVVGLEHKAKLKMGRPNSKEFVASSHHTTELDSVRRLSWFILLLAISDCEAMTLPGYSSLRMDSHSHTASSLALQLGNHSISQYACHGALRPTFIVGLRSCFLFGCGLLLLLRELNKDQHQRFVSKGCTLILWWFVLCSAVFFVIFFWHLR